MTGTTGTKKYTPSEVRRLAEIATRREKGTIVLGDPVAPNAVVQILAVNPRPGREPKEGLTYSVLAFPRGPRRRETYDIFTDAPSPHLAYLAAVHYVYRLTEQGRRLSQMIDGYPYVRVRGGAESLASDESYSWHVYDANENECEINDTKELGR